MHLINCTMLTTIMHCKIIIFLLLSTFIAFACARCGESGGQSRGKREVERNETDGPTEYIIGGRNANPGEFPWMARLKIYYDASSGKYSACGGVIWNQNWIVTAAHCLMECNNKNVKKPERVNICVGEHNTDKSDGEKCFYASRWWTHGSYDACDDKFKNDIAVIKFKDSLKIPSLTNDGYGSINTACHPNDNTNGNQAVLSGWGRFNTNKQENSKILKRVSLPVWSLKDCKNKWSVDESQICAGGNGGENSCNGDSGGPLVTYIKNQAYVIGLSSYGPNPCAQKGVPNVFTKVSYFNGWIKNMINNN